MEPLFVGRAREREALEGALDRARAGAGGTVLVAGEAGIGKTRLAAEVATRARVAGVDVLLGRSIDLIGAELPYQPFVEALHPLADLRRAEAQTAGTQLRIFEQTLALLAERAAAAPVLLVIEDLHWADASTLDLVVFLAHSVATERVLLLGTYRADEPSSAERVARLARGVRRAASALVLELGPLPHEELTTLLAAHGGAALPAPLIEAIAGRAEGNPFFAEELLAAAADHGGELPRALRDLLLQRVVPLDAATQGLLRLAAAAGRDVGYPLLCAATALAEPEVRESLRRAVERGVLVAEPARGSFRFRHALLAEAISATILPGEREELHARLARELARSGAASPAELAPHWEAAGRAREALAASVEASQQAAAVFGLAEARGHLERALTLWDAVPDAAELTGLDLAEVCARAAELARQTGTVPRALELCRRAIELVGEDDPRRAARLHVNLGEYLYAAGWNEAGLASLGRAVELAPAEPPTADRAYALGSLAGGLMMIWRRTESLPVAEQALAVARTVGAAEAEVRALTVIGGDLVYLGSTEDGVAHFRHALQLAEQVGDVIGLERAYLNFMDALTMLARYRESAALGQAGLEAMRRFGVAGSLLVMNQMETLLALGEWDEAERLGAVVLRGSTEDFSYVLAMRLAELETGRGDFDAARAHLDAATRTLRDDRLLGLYDADVAELAVWERRFADAEAAVDAGLAEAETREAAQIRVQLCATGLRVQAELAALARARRDEEALRARLERARTLADTARRAAADASPVTPNADGWWALAEAEHERARGVAAPERWAAAAEIWRRLERPPLAAYCRWREAEALVAGGASRSEASVPLREAHAVAARLGARPLIREVELLAQRARLDLEPPNAASAARRPGLRETLGLTPREAEVLTLVARGYTNREIATTLVISDRTAGVHVSHILHKLNAPNRLEAAAIAHRLAPPSVDDEYAPPP
jgi:DNA-binding CsgD family transcriptional regulator/tetratricopeptide (TPR) repeat protein